MKKQKNVYQCLLEDYCDTREFKKAKQLWRKMNHVLCMNDAYTILSQQFFTKNHKHIIAWMQALGTDHLLLTTVEHTFSHACGSFNNQAYVEYMHRLNQTRDRSHPYYLDEYVYIHAFFAACKHGRKQMSEYLLRVYGWLLQQSEYLNQGLVLAQQENQHEMAAWLRHAVKNEKQQEK